MVLHLLRAHRDRAPDAVAIRTSTPDGWTTTTWSQLYDETVSVTTRLTGTESPVVVVVDGSAASIATVLGVLTAGVDAVLLEPGNSYLDDPRSPVHALRPTAVLAPPGFSRHSGSSSATSDAEAPRVAEEPGDVLQLTSGSTGEPRIARQPLGNLLHGGETYRYVFELGEDDDVLATVPLAHSFGFVGGVCAALVSGASLRVLTRFRPAQVLSALDDGASVLLGTPLVYQLLAPLLPNRRTLRLALSSGGPLAPETAADVERALGTPVRQVYGSTETGLIACHPAAVPCVPPGSVGFPAPGVTLHVAPSGRLIVRTPTLFTGYAGNGATRASRTGNGATWASEDTETAYDTGDEGRVDAAGHLFVEGRKDTFVNVGGRKVNPRRVERILAEHPGVREAYVYGTPGEEQRLAAAVVLADGTDADEVIAFCRERRLAPYEVPHRLHVMDRLPRTAMGKVDRRRVVAATHREGANVG